MNSALKFLLVFAIGAILPSWSEGHFTSTRRPLRSAVCEALMRVTNAADIAQGDARNALLAITSRLQYLARLPNSDMLFDPLGDTSFSTVDPGSLPAENEELQAAAHHLDYLVSEVNKVEDGYTYVGYEIRGRENICALLLKYAYLWRGSNLHRLNL